MPDGDAVVNNTEQKEEQTNATEGDEGESRKPEASQKHAFRHYVYGKSQTGLMHSVHVVILGAFVYKNKPGFVSSCQLYLVFNPCRESDLSPKLHLHPGQTFVHDMEKAFSKLASESLLAGTQTG